MTIEIAATMAIQGMHPHKPIEDREFCDETGEARHAHGHQAADDKADRRQRHDLADIPPNSGIWRV